MRKFVCDWGSRVMAVLLIAALVLVLSPFDRPETTAFAASSSTTVSTYMDKFQDASGTYDYWLVPSGSYKNLYVGQYTAAGLGNCQTVLRFDLPNLGSATIASARLRFGVRFSSNDPAINIYGSNNDTGWTETDATIPNKDVTILTGAAITEADTYYAETIVLQTFDVTSFVQSQYAGDRKVTLVLSIADTGKDNDICFGASEDSYTQPQLLLDYTTPSSNLQTSPAATEANLNGKQVTLTLEDVTFTDGTLNPGNFSLSGAPAGLSISGVSYTDATHCQLTMAYDGRDIDSNKSFAVSIAGSELSSGAVMTTTLCPISANNDGESISAANDGLIAEGAENNEVITVTLTGGQFANPVNPANWTVNNLPAGVSKGTVTRAGNGTVTVALSGNATADYDVDRNVTVSCTNAEYVDSAGGGTLTSNGVTITANNDAESIAAANDGNIAEGAENGEAITVTLTGGQFAGTITPANWTVSGLPVGVSKGSVTRVDGDTVTITLSGNATADYDVNKAVTVSCTAAEYADSSGGGALTSNSVTITASNDGESLSAANDGNIAEGAEDGEILTVTLTGGQFANPVNPANWTVSGLPVGVSKGTVARVDGGTVTIAFSGNASVDYDANLSVNVTCSADEYTDNTGGGALTSNGVTFTANNDGESISATNDGNIAEGAENGEVITVTLTGGQFANPVDADHWAVSGLPAGVSKGTVTRVDGDTVTIALLGNAAVDYDASLSASVTCTAAEYNDSTGGSSLTSNAVTITANNDGESISAANDGNIAEGAENGEVITVTLTGGQFVSPVNPANWTVSGLPVGVSKGTVARVDGDTVTIALSGNATADYDVNKAVTVSCTAAEYADSSGGGSLTSNGVTMTANNDGESISAANDGTIAEGEENGEVITVTLTGGQFANPVDPDHWTVSGLPAGVSKGTVTRVDGDTVTIALSGNAAVDYDANLSTAVTCTADEYTDNTGGGALTSNCVTITANNDAESISAANDGNIAEGVENGEVITVTLTGSRFAGPIDPNNWTVSGLPAGVIKGTVARASDTTVRITLSGNASVDFDSNRTVTVSCSSAEYGKPSAGSLTSNGVAVTANNDAESITAANDGSITEGAENGEVITVTLAGGQFAGTITPANWTVTGLPAGVSRGTVTRVNANTVSIALSGNAAVDYDANLNINVNCTADEYTDNTGGGVLTSNAVQLTAVNDPEVLAAYDDGEILEGAENGEIITVRLSGGQFASPIDPAAWAVGNLPAGVTKGAVTRVDDRTVRITLSGNSTGGIDASIDVTVTCAASQYVSAGGPLTAAGDVVIWPVIGPDPTAGPTAIPTTSPTPVPTASPTTAPAASPTGTDTPAATPSPSPATTDPGATETAPAEPTATAAPTGSAQDPRVVIEEHDTETGIVAVGVDSVTIPELREKDVEKVVVQLVVKKLDTKLPGSIAIAGGKLDEDGKELLMVFDASLVKTVYRSDGTSADAEVDNGDITGTITVRIPLPAEFEDMPGLTVVYIDDGGVVTELRTRLVTIDGQKYLEFETNHFSQYAIISNPHAGNWWLWLVAFVAVLATGLIVALLVLKRRSGKA